MSSKSWVGEYNGRRGRFVAYFKHWRSGKVIYAKDYGRKAFFFPF